MRKLENKFKEVIESITNRYNEKGSLLLIRVVKSSVNKKMAQAQEEGKSIETIENIGLEDLKDNQRALKAIGC